MGYAPSPLLGGNKLKLGFSPPNYFSGMTVTRVLPRLERLGSRQSFKA